MRVLHFVKTSVGGAWAWRQVRELARVGIDVHVALPPGPMVKRYVSVGATVHPMPVDLPLLHLQRGPGFLRNIRGLVADVRPDLIHIHNVGPALAVRAALGRSHSTPRIFQVPGPLHLEHRLSRYLELASAGGADWWIASCQYTWRLYIAAGVAEERLRTSYYGTDTDEFLQPQTSTDLRGDLGISKTTRLIGMVAYIYPPKLYLGQHRGPKGHEDLIDAVGIGLREGADVAVVFVGGARQNAAYYERRLRMRAKRQCGDRAFFVGQRADIPQLYPDLDVAVHPSLSENVGGAVESLLSRVPTVATAVGGLPEVVRQRETGWLVPPRKPRVLWQAIADALSDPGEARRMAEAGRRLALELFDISRTAKEVRLIYEDILASR